MLPHAAGRLVGIIKSSLVFSPVFFLSCLCTHQPKRDTFPDLNALATGLFSHRYALWLNQVPFFKCGSKVGYRNSALCLERSLRHWKVAS